MDSKRIFGEIMGIYTHLYNQKSIFKKVTGKDSYSKPITIDKPIDCRIEYKNKLITNSTGQQATSLGNLMCDEEIIIGDIINTQGRDYKVIQSNPLVDFDGVTQAYSVDF